ncbi:NAD+ synthase [Candidatus Methylospira mobilis]|uniref:Glutamine-dependent NAD(+) synthetase n=1 Tax=Candidatus Methylospira mobilis TaxID=1808979 RepID=A0A5Q0BHP1_9GAMM|nr:NAD+ synthase [Candidatus Methylospira mobilis]QFY41346.1 NAD+ synthase [Candidatus Methylospira mobilis]WNV05426.1 NAD+ synthase [Candidatus Methylospira mobilis]
MRLRIAIAQVNLLVGAIAGNAEKLIRRAQEARDRHQADVVVFPELSLTGYPPEDLLLRPDFLDQIDAALQQVAAQTRGIAVVLGFPEPAGDKLYNSALVIRAGERICVYRKHALPNYGVFDEKRYFAAGSEAAVFELQGVTLGLTICEDVWVGGVVEQAAAAGAQIVLNLNASPFSIGKDREREDVVAQRVETAQVPVVYANLVGGQDELIFDGASFAMNADGTVVFRAPACEEHLGLIDFDGRALLPGFCAPALPEAELVYRALVLGIRDYVAKNGFEGAVLGLSGGIDSALTLALAVDALGADRVMAVLMPSRYTADISIIDARLEAEALGVAYHQIPIMPAVDAFTQMLAPVFAGAAADATEENLQARARGVLLMAISNKTGRMLLTTGNKSEMSVGYATLYGDMAGGFAPLKDIPKLLVYRLSEYRNTLAPVIPLRVIERPPSAELAPDQKDEDSLPPYAVLDPILALYIEEDQSIEAIIALGFERRDVERVVAMVDRNEYKRRQAPPGIKVSPRAFGRDRRYPITSGFIHKKA